MRPVYPTSQISAWCKANELGEECCIDAVKQVYKRTRLSFGFFPEKTNIDRWVQDPRPVIKTVHTCSDTGGYHECAKTIEVDDATKKLIQSKIPACNDAKKRAMNKSKCMKMKLGHCCNAITDTTDMTAGQIIETTKKCAEDAYPCQLFQAVRSNSPNWESSPSRTACLKAELHKREEAAHKEDVRRATAEFCQNTISEWDGGNANAYHCCIRNVSGFIQQHSKLPSEDFVNTKCDSVIKNRAELEADGAENWVKSALSF